MSSHFFSFIFAMQYGPWLGHILLELTYYFKTICLPLVAQKLYSWCSLHGGCWDVSFSLWILVLHVHCISWPITFFYFLFSINLVWIILECVCMPQNFAFIFRKLTHGYIFIKLCEVHSIMHHNIYLVSFTYSLVHLSPQMQLKSFLTKRILCECFFSLF